MVKRGSPGRPEQSLKTRELPTPETARRVWALVERRMGLRLCDLQRRDKRFKRAYVCDDIMTMQMFAVALHVAVTNPTVTQNSLFDALGARWSPAYMAAEATISYDMDPGRRGTPVLHDLRAHDLDFKALLTAIRKGCDGLYSAEPTKDGSEIELVESKTLIEYLQIVLADPAYRGDRGRLLLAEDPSPPLDRGVRDVAAEWAYNVVDPGPGGLEIIKILEKSRLFLNVTAYRQDFARTSDEYKVAKAERDRYVEAKKAGRSHPRTKEERDRYNEAKGDYIAARLIIADLDRIGAQDGYLLIKSRFFMGLNRRYYAADFWPIEVKGKDESTKDVSFFGLRATVKTWRRGRWFAAPAKMGFDQKMPLLGVDVSSSFLHTQAAFLGLDGLEEWLSENSYKKHAADLAQTMHRAGEITLPRGPEDPTLPKAANTASMMRTYGGRHISRGLRDAGFDLGNDKNVGLFVNDPRLKIHEILTTWEPAAAEIAKVACAIDPFAGIEFNAPLDNTPIRLNPIRRWKQTARPRGTVTVGRAAQLIYPDLYRKDRTTAVERMRKALDTGKVQTVWSKDRRRYVPLKTWKPRPGETERGVGLEEWVGRKLPAPRVQRMPSAGSEGISIYFSPPRATKNEQGDYRVSLPDLKDMVGPTLIHILDSLYASFVIRRFDALGGGAIVSIYDGWWVAADVEQILRLAIEEANQLWLESLGPVYEVLVHYLKDTKYGKWAQQLRADWDARKKANRWPKFRVIQADSVEVAFGENEDAWRSGPLVAALLSEFTSEQKET